MNKAKQYIFLLILCTILTACRIDANSILEPEEVLVVSIHNLTGTTVTKKEIRKGDETYNRLKKWMVDNEKGWDSSLVTFVPSVEVRGKNFNLNFHQTRAILNFQSPDGKNHQYVKDIKESEFQFLLQK